MASTDTAMPVNGSYGQHSYDAVTNNYAAANSNGATGYDSVAQPAATQTGANTSTSEIPKDEVGWYFVEQYYTTLSKSPDRLSLFYNKRSQFVSGTEEDKVQVCMGQKAINDRIKELDFNDTKVRVTNVDSQGSDANIVIQVIGEISNKGQPHKRFVQTFVLAEQTNGYFVLNDIFRYLAEEPEEEEEVHEPSNTGSVQEPASSGAVPEAEAVKGEHDTVAHSEEDLAKVDEKLEDVAQEEPADAVAPAINGTPIPEEAEVAPAEEAPAAGISASNEASVEEPEVPAAPEAIEPEKPQDPSPTPVAAPQKPAQAATRSAPPKPAVPRTWASLAASAHKVAMPATLTSTAPQASSQASSQGKTATPTPSQPQAAPAAAPVAAPTSATALESSPAISQGETTGWQNVTGHKKEPARPQNQAQGGDADKRRAYIKNVFSQVDEDSLKEALGKFGEIEYLDISRQRNCAFIDFKTAAAFQNAVASNPHRINDLDLNVEERRVRPQQPFQPFRGGAPRGRGGMPSRGGFNPRGRGGPNRGRGAAPQEA